ncbi:probable apyrase 7 isoform X2 [Andrographis paniculata]|uniref:probable apyrase 7 isoform X2 n=1 Tax=Andrographis paniculata TaxID=175694 RepID=UPI0021E87811|nr:probable apyrase 7 isoform X2 [Andrographis paniculata]
MFSGLKYALLIGIGLLYDPNSSNGSLGRTSSLCCSEPAEVVLDCGSTGSRVSVFEWLIGNGSSVNGGLPIMLHSYPDRKNITSGCEYHCLQTEPGLHNFVYNSTAVRASLEPLIRYAEHRVPLERRFTTPILALATAGMRRLAAEDAALVLENIRRVVKEHGFLYREDWIRVLSGKEEAYYGWVALNYRMGVFGSTSRVPTLGLLDLGGSSLQVVAEVDGSIKDERVFRAKIGRVRRDIVAYSLPAFGLNEAFGRSVVMLSHGGRTFEVRHPCLGSGFAQNYTCWSCFGMDSADSDEHLYVVGEPNWELCKRIARAVAINSSSPDLFDQYRDSKCLGLFSYGGNTTLNITRSLHYVSRYHAMSGFFAIYRALNLSQTLNLSTLWESGENLCARSGDNPKGFNGQDCFRMPYLASLIENALCLAGVDIIFGPGDVSWTLGASLVEAEFLWHNRDASPNNNLVLKRDLRLSSSVFTFVLLSSLLLVFFFLSN